MPPLVVLVGPPGAGKSTVGRLLASRFGTTFRDTDVDVETVAGMKVAEVFLEHGEERFRDLERAAVKAALAEHDGVLALGGGAVLDADTRELLRGNRVVYLEVDLADATKRVGFNRERPLLLGNPRAQLHALLEARRPFYEQVATATIVSSGKTVTAVAAEVAEVLR
ncbi:MAG: shikimate kinase [Actinomycetota bacterium]|jgi:shikimate kinase|nr:shikimate kinase [Actinomycetota bacterium]MDQ1466134.1 shikimate kinase [Actinomycetota bacterium]MDQ1493930.1 shikimate kinase [Actinomycetota bacterium]